MGEITYGLWAILNSILLFSTVGTLGIGVVINKYGSEEGEDALDPVAIMTSGSIVLITTAVLLCSFIIIIRIPLTNWINIPLDDQKDFSLALTFIAVSLIPLFLSRGFQGYLYSQLRYDIGRWVETGMNISLWIGVIIIASRGYGIDFMTGWGLFVFTVMCSIFIWFLFKQGVIQWKWDVEVFSKLRSFSVYTFIESLAISLYQNFDRILVGIVLGPGLAGVYSIGTSIGLRLTIITGQITDVLVPYSSRKGSLEAHDEIYYVFRSVSRLITLIISFFASLLILWMEVILRLWISPGYSESYSFVFRIIILAYLILSICRPGHQTLVGLGKIRATSITYLIASMIMLAGIYIGSNSFGLIGAAGANMIMSVLFIYNFIVYKSLKKQTPWKVVLMDIGILSIFPAISFFIVNAYFSTLLLLSATSIFMMLLTAFIIALDPLLRKFIRDQIKSTGGLVTW
jgi:O-antigen/teichoic acid export membrane protein